MSVWRPVWLVLLLAVAPVQAGQVPGVTVERHGDAYEIVVRADIEAPSAFVYARLTDFANLTELSPSILKSTVLEHVSARQQKVRTLSRFCVLFLCINLTQEQIMTMEPPARLKADILDAHSFRGESASWYLCTQGHRTLMVFRATMIPDFWVPPFIGTLLVRAALEREARLTVEGFEALWAERAG